MTDAKPTPKAEDDRLSFSLSEEEAEDTTDSLDIKPPQAVMQRKPAKHKKEKASSREGRHPYAKGHHPRGEDRRKELKGERSRRERDPHYKEGHKHKSEHREREKLRGEREHSRTKRDGHEYREERIVTERRLVKEASVDERTAGKTVLLSKEGESEVLGVRVRSRTKQNDCKEERIVTEKRVVKERGAELLGRRKQDSHKHNEERIVTERRVEKEGYLENRLAGEQLQNDLRGKLLDKRSQRELRAEEPERKKVKKEKREKEELPMETERERLERLQNEERKEKLLKAEREMALRKEVSRRELEARRERHNIEKQKNKMLEQIALKHKRDKEEAEQGEEGEIAEKSVEEEEDDDDDDDDDSSSSSSSSSSDEEGTEKEASEGGTPTSAPPLAKSPRSPDPIRTPERGRNISRSPSKSESRSRSRSLSKEQLDRNADYYANDSPKSDIILKDDLPLYLPAIQGCRSVEEFQCLNKIEEGTYGVVYRARDKRRSDIVALKRLKMEKEKEGFPITSLREINTLLKAQHPNIVTVREIVVGSNMDKIFIVMDYVEHDLKSLMETMKSKKQVFVPGEIKCIMVQLLRAVAHLHDNWILHRDLKTSNLLLSHKGILKVGDFGLAREYGSPLKAYTPIVVTLWYRAPELLLQCKEYTTAIDMWSVGCIFAELLQMEALFPGRSEMDQLNRIFKELGTPNEKVWPGYNKLPAIQKITFTEYPVNRIRNRFGTMLSDHGVNILNGFLTYDPAQRLTAETALQHEYFKEVPLPIDPAMFPTWPAKSEQGIKKSNNSPKPPSGGKEYKQLGDSDEEMPSGGFHMGAGERRANVFGPGFSLKF